MTTGLKAMLDRFASHGTDQRKHMAERADGGMARALSFLFSSHPDRLVQGSCIRSTSLSTSASSPLLIKSASFTTSSLLFCNCTCHLLREKMSPPSRITSTPIELDDRVATEPSQSLIDHRQSLPATTQKAGYPKDSSNEGQHHSGWISR
jgi:hypothetical protein